MDSNEKGDETFKANYDKFYPMIANKEDFDDDILYFWAIEEAKNINESSLVLFGSNSTTGRITNSKEAAEQAPQKQEEEAAEQAPIQREKTNFYLKQLKG